VDLLATAHGEVHGGYGPLCLSARCQLDTTASSVAGFTASLWLRYRAENTTRLGPRAAACAA